MKRCPFCAEKIQDAAIKCRWCGAMLAPPPSPPPPPEPGYGSVPPDRPPATPSARPATPRPGGLRAAPPRPPAPPSVQQASPEASGLSTNMWALIVLGIVVVVGGGVAGLIAASRFLSKGAETPAPPPAQVATDAPAPPGSPTAVAPSPAEGANTIATPMSDEAKPLKAPFDAQTAQQAQRQWAKKLNLEPEVTSAAGIKLVLIAPGTFTMGTPRTEVGRKDDEGPQHKVTLTKPYYIGKYLVTVGQFRDFVTASGYRTVAEKSNGCYVWTNGNCHFQSGGSWQNPGFAQEDTNPVVCMGWPDVTAYVGWLSQKEGKTFRLPTEAEWDYASRAGTTTANFMGDDEASLRASGWYLGNSGQRTHPVGELAGNAFGLYDMHGNAWQWCSDWYANRYPAEDQVDPQGPPTGEYHVVRGCAWTDVATAVRAGARYESRSETTLANMGFRVARDAD